MYNKYAQSITGWSGFSASPYNPAFSAGVQFGRKYPALRDNVMTAGKRFLAQLPFGDRIPAVKRQIVKDNKKKFQEWWDKQSPERQERFKDVYFGSNIWSPEAYRKATREFDDMPFSHESLMKEETERAVMLSALLMARGRAPVARTGSAAYNVPSFLRGAIMRDVTKANLKSGLKFGIKKGWDVASGNMLKNVIAGNNGGPVRQVLGGVAKGAWNTMPTAGVLNDYLVNFHTGGIGEGEEGGYLNNFSKYTSYIPSVGQLFRKVLVGDVSPRNIGRAGGWLTTVAAKYLPDSALKIIGDYGLERGVQFVDNSLSERLVGRNITNSQDQGRPMSVDKKKKIIEMLQGFNEGLDSQVVAQRFIDAYKNK